MPKAFDKSINTAPVYPLLSRVFSHFSMSEKKSVMGVKTFSVTT